MYEIKIINDVQCIWFDTNGITTNFNLNCVVHCGIVYQIMKKMKSSIIFSILFYSTSTSLSIKCTL